MAHRYGQPIQMTLAAGGQPSAFGWRGARYRIVETLSTWRLRDRWWETPGGGASDRTYYRVRCAGEQFFDLYYDAASDVWMLDRAHD